MIDQLSGKRGLIMGVANERSIAWGIAKSMSDAGGVNALIKILWIIGLGKNDRPAFR